MRSMRFGGLPHGITHGLRSFTAALVGRGHAHRARILGNACAYFYRLLMLSGWCGNLKNLRAADVARVLDDRAREGCARSTLLTYVAGLAAFDAWAAVAGGPRVPVECLAVKPPRVKRSDGGVIRALSEMQQGALYSFARGLVHGSWGGGRLLLFCALGIECGLRPSELLHLDWGELHLRADVPFLRLVDLPRRALKNSLAGQALTLPAGILGLIAHYKLAPACGTGRVFPGRGHTAWLHRAGKTFGAPGLNAHWLRRTFCTNLYRRGVDLQAITVLMRHRNPVVLNVHYLQRPELVDVASGRPVELGQVGF